MAFVSEPDAFRTYDPERKMELVREGVGGGSSGYEPFKIKGPGQEIAFYAKLTSTAAIPELNTDCSAAQPCWVISTGGTLDSPFYSHLRPIIAEAMIAFRSSFGVGQPQWQYHVYFEPARNSND